MGFEPTVSVRLRQGGDRISIGGQDLALWSTQQVRDGLERGREPLVQIRGYSRIQLRLAREDKRVTWYLLSDDGVKTTRFPSGVIELTGTTMRIDLRPVPDAVRLVATSDSLRGAKIKTNIVGLLSLENYIEGVVATEVPRDWPDEALKAQAIAARSFTLAKIRERSGHGRTRNNAWLLEANVVDQVFDHQRIHARAVKAVAETRGEYLANADGETPVAAHYHSDCGGKTDEPSTVWGGGPRLGTAIDASCPLNPGGRWRLVQDASELGRKLSQRSLVPGGSRVQSVAILHRSTGGRAVDIEIVSRVSKSGLETKQAIRLSGEKLREALGYGDLRSTRFEIGRTIDGAFEFVGRGFGHGAGMCQWGARAMAQAGHSHQTILQHYFPALNLAKYREGSGKRQVTSN